MYTVNYKYEKYSMQNGSLVACIIIGSLSHVNKIPTWDFGEGCILRGKKALKMFLRYFIQEKID